MRHQDLLGRAARLPGIRRTVRYERTRGAPTGRTYQELSGEDEQMVKVAIAGLLGAFLVFYIMTSPDQAATMVKGAGHVATNVAHGVGDFLDKLAS
jgi:hypothetical protein